MLSSGIYIPCNSESDYNSMILISTILVNTITV